MSEWAIRHVRGTYDEDDEYSKDFFVIMEKDRYGHWIDVARADFEDDATKVLGLINGHETEDRLVQQIKGERFLADQLFAALDAHYGNGSPEPSSSIRTIMNMYRQMRPAAGEEDL